MPVQAPYFAAQPAHTPPRAPSRTMSRSSSPFGNFDDVAAYLFNAMGTEVTHMARAVSTAHTMQRRQGGGAPRAGMGLDMDMVAAVTGSEGLVDEAAELNTLRLRRLEASAPVDILADVDADMEAADEATYWTEDTRLDDDDVSWARRHGELDRPGARGRHGPGMGHAAPRGAGLLAQAQPRRAASGGAMLRPGPTFRRGRASLSDMVFDAEAYR